ncbi:MAG: hypothetical protein GY716_11100 [bacterium]|nr:hypothetical protein [bacterium]
MNKHSDKSYEKPSVRTVDAESILEAIGPASALASGAGVLSGDDAHGGSPLGTLELQKSGN